MTTPLMSAGLFGAGSITMKHVVPWKTREEFLLVCANLYSKDKAHQLRAVNKINMWKSRAGSKLSVAIECSGALMQALLDYADARREDKLKQTDFQLRSSLSLSVIRFVNHITEKGQTKAVAQPVHVIAKEFDIPEWIVRLRHDATHNHLPSLDTLVVAATWALDYLKEKFWDEQRVGPDEIDQEEQTTGPTISEIRNAVYDFQREMFKERKDKRDERSKDCDRRPHADCLRTLQKYLNQNRMKFLQCLLEDGVLVATEEQLEAFGIQNRDLLHELPPKVPEEITEFWSPLLKKIHSSGCLALLVQSLMFSVGYEEGLHNYQLVAWLSYILAQSEGAKGKSKNKKKRNGLFKTPPPLPKKMLLTACLQNINVYTAFLLKHLGDTESLGEAAHTKLTKLLDLHSRVTASHTSSSEDSDTVYTLEDVMRVRLKRGVSKKLSASEMNEIEDTVEDTEIPWKLCTDLVDWSTVPFGVIPTSQVDEKPETTRPSSSSSLSSSEHRKTSKRRKEDSSSDERYDSDSGENNHQRRRSSRDDEDDDDDYDDNTETEEGEHSDHRHERYHRRIVKRHKYRVLDDHD